VRDEVFGIEIGTKSQFIVREGLFLMSKIDARYGAFGIIPSEVDGGIITGNFWAYEVDKSVVNIECFNLFISSQSFYDICEKASSGTTHRKYISEDIFLSLEIELPIFTDQLKLVEDFKSKKVNFITLQTELKTQATLLTKLRQAYLQEAVMGKLTASTTDDAHDLLDDIKAQKAQLIKEGKLRKEKPLPPIKPEEIPFEIPKNWVWCRLGEICEIKGGKRLPSGFSLQKLPTDYIYLRVSDMANGTISDSDLHYLTEEAYFLLKNYTISETDIYMTIVGGTIGKCGLIPSKYDGAILTENAAKIIPHSVAKEFLLFLFKSDFCQNQFIDKTKQVGVQKMALNRFDKTLIPLPPLSEQQAIVAKVEGLLKKVSALEAENKAQQAELERLMGAVLQESFSTTVFQTVQES